MQNTDPWKFRVGIWRTGGSYAQQQSHDLKSGKHMRFLFDFITKSTLNIFTVSRRASNSRRWHHWAIHSAHSKWHPCRHWTHQAYSGLAVLYIILDGLKQSWSVWNRQACAHTYVYCSTTWLNKSSENFGLEPLQFGTWKHLNGMRLLSHRN